MRAKKLAFPLLAAVLFLGGSATRTEAQSYAQQVWNQLQAAYEAANDDDYTLNYYIIGSLNSSATDSWTFSFNKGTQYMIIGACDTDCSDIDMTIKDESGSVVASDTADDDVPIVRFTAGGSGRLTVETKMYTCTGNPCYFGFGIFRQ
jgi:hypothetical protein